MSLLDYAINNPGLSKVWLQKQEKLGLITFVIKWEPCLRQIENRCRIKRPAALIQPGNLAFWKVILKNSTCKCAPGLRSEAC